MNKTFLRQLISGSTPPEGSGFHAFLDRVMQNEASKSEVVAFLAGLSARPLIPGNVHNFVSYNFQLSPAKRLEGSEGAVNIVGTGGGIPTFNISTAVAFVASAAGAKVLKSGSAAYSSQCGSLDVLDALSVPMPASESELADMIGELGIGFVPASHYGPLLKQLIAKALPLPFRDIAGFVNTIGPLLCPYRVSAQLIGVGRLEHLEVFSEVLARSKPPKTLLVHAHCGLDEFCSIGVNYCRLIGEEVQRFSLYSRNLGFGGGSLANLAGGSVRENAEILHDVLSGKRKGEARDTVILNSAALLFLAGVAPSIEDGIQLAAITINNGKAIRQLERVVAWGTRSGSLKRPFAAMV
ncbi:MAG: anthranilate phosphoribosyltransferase [Methylococcales bacterium]